MSRRRSATILKSFSAGMWSKTIPSRIASTSILSLFIAYLIGGVGRLVIDLKAEDLAEDGTDGHIARLELALHNRL